MTRSIFCSSCKIEKEPGREGQSYCKECKRKYLEAKRAKAKPVIFKPRRPKSNWLRKGLCPDCDAVKENPKQSYCNSCRSKRSKAWQIETGRIQKVQTGLCSCGAQRAPNQAFFCSQCKAADSRKYRKVKVYTEEEKQAEKQRRQAYYQANKERFKKRFNEDETYRSKVLARKMVNKYVSEGLLKMGACKVCGTSEKVDAHHEDYMKPLDVIWLCRKHHHEHHVNERILKKES